MRTFITGSLIVLVGVLAAALPAHDASANATLIVVNNDMPGEGFNDPTPFTPVGGNPATTLGQARLNAFQHSADLWGACLNSNVTILINATMDPLTCTSTSAVLGQAGATTVHANFTNAPVANTWYCQALANSLANTDLDPTTSDITAQFNSAINGSAGCLGGYSWYYGYDGNPGVNQIDFVSVVTHEIGHGLGFQTFCDLSTGMKLSGLNDAYMLNLDRAGAAQPNYSLMSNTQRVAANKSDPNLRWVGSDVTTTAGTIPVTAGLNGGYVRLHAPMSLAPGSSVSHYSTAVTPNELMEPSYTGPNHNLTLTAALFGDIGWSLVNKCTAEVTTVNESDTLTVTQSTTTWEVKVEVTNTGGFQAYNVSASLSGGPGWLSIPDPNCAYPNLAAGASSFGTDSYTLDITGWPGGAFTVNVDINWEDVCGNAYNTSVPVDLLPATLPTPVGGRAYSNRLDVNIPNPFNPSTSIHYEIGRNDVVTLRVYDVAGRLVRTLVSGERGPGAYEARWDGRDDAGRGVASGVYFYRLQAGAFTQTRRMVLLK